MGTARRGKGEDQALDHDKDRYPEFVPLLRRITQEGDIPEGPVERLEITCLANGDATYRIWSARAEEPEGGFLPGQ